MKSIFLALIVVGALAAKGGELDVGLLGYWPLDGNVADLINGGHGIPRGGINRTSYVEGPVGKALYLDGVDDYVRVDSPNPFPGDDVRAVSFWTRVEGESGSILYTAEGWFVDYQVPGFVLGAGHLRPAKPILQGKDIEQWHHIVAQSRFIRNDGVGGLIIDGEMFVDGELLPPSSWTPNTNPVLIPQQFFNIGGLAGTKPWFRGTIDELAIWDRGLTIEEVNQLLQAGRNGESIAMQLPDDDRDGLPDMWEKRFGFGDHLNGDEDSDDDGLTNQVEWRLGLDPLAVDSDADGLDDAFESASGVFSSETDTGTNPRLADSDEDGIQDGEELRLDGLDLHAWDTDQDGFGDGDERSAGTDPTDPNSKPDIGIGLKAYWSFDGDLNDGQNEFHGTLQDESVSLVFEPGIIGDAVLIRDGVGIGIQSSPEEFAFENKSFSVSCWCRLDSWFNGDFIPHYLLSQVPCGEGHS